MAVFRGEKTILLFTPLEGFLAEEAQGVSDGLESAVITWCAGPSSHRPRRPSSLKPPETMARMPAMMAIGVLFTVVSICCLLALVSCLNLS